MAEIKEKATQVKLQKNSKTVYPQTISDAVVDTDTNKTLTESLKSIKKSVDEAENWSIRLQTYYNYKGVQKSVDENEIIPNSTFSLDGRYFANIASAVTISTNSDGFPVEVHSKSGVNGVFNSIHFGTGLFGTAVYDDLGSGIEIFCNPQISFAIGSNLGIPCYGTMPIQNDQFSDVCSISTLAFNSNHFYLDSLGSYVRLNVGLPVLHISSGISYLPSEYNPIFRGLKIGTGLTYNIRRPEDEVEKFESRMFDDNDGGIVELFLSDQQEKQNKTDNNLKTTSKDIVGAINEVKSGADNKQDKLSNYKETSNTSTITAPTINLVNDSKAASPVITVNGGKAYYSRVLASEEIAKKGDIPTYSVATTTTNGLLSKEDKAKVDTIDSLRSAVTALTNRVAALEKAATTTTTTTTTTVPPSTSTTTAGATGTPRAKANNWDEEDTDQDSLSKSVDDYLNGETV